MYIKCIQVVVVSSLYRFDCFKFERCATCWKTQDAVCDKSLGRGSWCARQSIVMVLMPAQSAAVLKGTGNIDHVWSQHNCPLPRGKQALPAAAGSGHA